MQVAAIVISLAFTLVGVALLGRAAYAIVRTVRLGQPVRRTDNPAARLKNMLVETLGHTRMLKWTLVGAAHWFVFVGFGLLFFTLVTAYGQLFDPHFALPLIGHWWPSELVTEAVTTIMLVAIVTLIVLRQVQHPRRLGRGSRFFGSRMWQAYVVEGVILGVGICIMVLRGLEGAQLGVNGPDLHFSFSYPLVALFDGWSPRALENAIWVVATLKIVISMTWAIILGLNLTMGVAWHRFTAFFNIFFKREPSGRTALGALRPMTVGGEPIDLEKLEDLDEDAVLGVGKVEDFTWKGLLDFTTCTECGRCQSQCPAWNTGKPLSPKLLITSLREHTFAKAPYLLAGGGKNADGEERATAEQLAGVPAGALREAERALVGPRPEDPTGAAQTHADRAGVGGSGPTKVDAHSDLDVLGGVIDPDVLWSCTMCGACVEQCPVDIEHVDTIVDLRRYQVLIESEYPSELNGLFKNLEKSGNPWGVNASKRMDWAKGLPFEVKQVGGGRPGDPESLDEVEWLFWVGCAGAFEDRAKKTTAAVAELLNAAGVTFAVLGDGEGCTGDPARRAGNEFLFQQFAAQNIEVLGEAKAKKVVSTCAHCFNTLKNEYSQLGIELEVVHHTQLLNRLVREGRLTPVASPAGSIAANGAKPTPITYHDPCYIGRHNDVYEPPRELLAALPGTRFTEMPRNSSRSFCCGAGGARMWMEERIGKRINNERTEEAIATGAEQIAVGCPFCRIMLSDGVSTAQQNGLAAGVEVLDVAQMLLAAVRRGDEPERVVVA